MSKQTFTVDAMSSQACCCIGPQNGEPVCPCKMKDLRIIDGRYVQVIDYGPAQADERCLHDLMYDPNNSLCRSLSCPCPKCSPRC